MEDFGHFLVDCEEFQGGRRLLLDRVRNIEGAGKWVDFFESGGKEEKVLAAGADPGGVSRGSGPPPF